MLLLGHIHLQNIQVTKLVFSIRFKCWTKVTCYPSTCMDCSKSSYDYLLEDHLHAPGVVPSFDVESLELENSSWSLLQGLV